MRVLFACGGTAGHIYPAVSVADAIKERYPESTFIFIGAEGKMEMDIVPREGYDIISLPISNISRELSLCGLKHNLSTGISIIKSLKLAKKLIKDFSPDFIIGTGGYVCYPVLYIGARLKIPTLVHESNVFPGLTTKMLAPHVDKILLGVESGKSYYKDKSKLVFTGTPVRTVFLKTDKLAARRELGLDEQNPLVLSVWGSLGSEHMNSIMLELIPRLAEEKSIHLVHSAGKAYYKEFMDELLKKGFSSAHSENVDVCDYIYNLDKYLIAADLVICRAGASTLAELTYLGKPAIIVPSPNVTNNHQEKNAEVIGKSGAALLMTEGSFDSGDLYSVLLKLLNDTDTLDAMGKAMEALSVKNSTDRILEVISPFTNATEDKL